MYDAGTFDPSEPHAPGPMGDASQPFTTEIIHIGPQALRVGRQAGNGVTPL